MKNHLLLLLLLITSSNLSFGKYSNSKIDTKFENILNINDEFIEDYEPDSVWYRTCFLTLKYKWNWGKRKPVYYYINDWKWESPANVNMLRCKDEKLYNYVRKKLYRNYKRKTICEKEEQYLLFRIDSIDNQLFLCAYNKDENERYITYSRVKEGTENGMLKGIWQIGNMLISVYGNAVNDYFEVIENIPMPSPLEPHDRLMDLSCKDYNSARYKNQFIYRNGYAIYKNGKIKRRYHKQKYVYPYDDDSFRKYIRNAESNR